MVRTVLLGVAIVAVGCGRAIVMTRTQSGGVIELDGDHSKGMEEANQRMAEHCGPNNYTIVQEGWERPETTPDDKWRVHYQCNTAIQQQQPMPAAAPMGAPPPDPAQMPPPPPPAPPPPG